MHNVLQALNKRQIRGNEETLATMGERDTGRRQITQITLVRKLL